MREVYSHAQVTIAATAAENARKGLFFDRKNPRLAPVQVVVSWKADPLPTSSDAQPTFFFEPGTYFVIDSGTELTDVDAAPLNSRAWAVQERYLSTRIMHFGQVLYWECPELLASEVHPRGIPSIFTCHFDGFAALKSRSLARRSNLFQFYQQPDTAALEDTNSEATLGIYGHWLRLRNKYSRCERTRDDDLLIALLGMAMDVAEMLYTTPSGQRQFANPLTMHTIFIAGMWKLFMIEELCWRINNHDKDAFRRPKRHQAPTWSWASSTNPTHGSTYRTTYSAFSDREPADIVRMFMIKPEDVGKLMQLCTVRYSAEVTDVQVNTSKLEDAANGHVRLKCRPFLAKVRLTPNHDIGAFVNPLLPDNSTLDLQAPGHAITFDSYIDTDEAEMQVTVVSLLYVSNDDMGFRGVEGLILQASTQCKGSYERIGHFSSGNPQDPHVPSGWVWARHEEAAEMEITIV